MMRNKGRNVYLQSGTTAPPVAGTDGAAFRQRGLNWTDTELRDVVVHSVGDG